MGTSAQHTVIAAWRAAGESGDAAAAGACLAADVELISPLTGKFRFRGPGEVTEVLSAAFEIIRDIRYHTELGDDRTRALFSFGVAGREPLEEAQLLRLDDDGRIRELTLFGRPVPALTEVMAGIGPRLLRRQKRAGLARVVGFATAPLNAMTRLGDRRLVPLADPRRRRG
ncbi:nuclear transport factor 2 family protein [Actinoplanes sp. NPDC048796]|uniref:nuclear transport factor 2 family protein n=1 Tax=Actinoplanes sp. NPDC048796 TaxID=3155640 RepID=UPI003405726E